MNKLCARGFVTESVWDGNRKQTSRAENAAEASQLGSFWQAGGRPLAGGEKLPILNHREPRLLAGLELMV